MYNRYVISQLVLAKLRAGRIVFYTKQACPIGPINSKVEHPPRAWIDFIAPLWVICVSELFLLKLGGIGRT